MASQNVRVNPMASQNVRVNPMASQNERAKRGHPVQGGGGGS